MKKKHCNKYYLIPDYQSAYHSNYSTETALVKLPNNILWGFENKQASALIVMDLSATFDTVDHKILIDVLEKCFGLEDTTLEWAKSYLQNHKCKVNIRNKYSMPRDQDFSVPQGSCPCAILSLVYTSTMENEIPPEVNLHRYADDYRIKEIFNPFDRESEKSVTDRPVDTTNDIKTWMDSN